MEKQTLREMLTDLIITSEQFDQADTKCSDALRGGGRGTTHVIHNTIKSRIAVSRAHNEALGIMLILIPENTLDSEAEKGTLATLLPIVMSQQHLLKVIGNK